MTHRAICILAREASDLMVRYQACFAGSSIIRWAINNLTRPRVAYSHMDFRTPLV
jgi:hypothetical protein